MVQEKVIIELEGRDEKLQKTLKNVEKTLGKLARTTQRTNKVAKDGLGKWKGFRFEFLGVMFAGQRLTRVFSNLLRPSAELFGLFDLWGIGLQLTFLPTMEKLLPLSIDLFDTFINLSPATQELIGDFALFGLGIGNLSDVIGTAVLAISAFKLAFPELFTQLFNLKNILATGFSFFLLFGGFRQLTEGKILQGIGSALAGIAWFLPGPFKAAAFAIGIALQVGPILRGEKMTTQDLVNLLISAGFVGAMVGGVYGLLITVGLSLVFLNLENIREYLGKLGRIGQGLPANPLTITPKDIVERAEREGPGTGRIDVGGINVNVNINSGDVISDPTKFGQWFADAIEGSLLDQLIDKL